MPEITTSTGPDTTPSIGFKPDLKDTDRAEIYLDGTLVLVGCGKTKRDPEDPQDLHQAVVGPDETTDLGTDPIEARNRVDTLGRRPDGQEIVTEMDQWAAGVAYGLARWLAMHRDRKAAPHTTNANTLLILAGQDYVEPLRDRGVFKYGASRMSGDPNDAYELDVDVRFLFEEIDAGGIGEQMGWLSTATDRLESDHDGQTEQAALGDPDE